MRPVESGGRGGGFDALNLDAPKFGGAFAMTQNYNRAEDFKTT
jgi:hypothetical protein